MSETLKSVEFADNFKDIEWVKQQVFAELKSLKNNINQNDNLFIKEWWKEWWKEFDVDLAKNYLDSIKNKTRSELSEKNASAWTMSVQISLESLWHDVGKIDGVFWPKTKNAITDFQNKWNNENSNDEILVDWLAGKATIDRILKKLNNSTIESTDSSKGKELFDKLKQSNEILTDIKKQYTLPELNRYAEVKNDYVSTTASTKVILTSKINWKNVKISFDKEANNLEPTALNIYSLLAETNYTNPTLISGQDSFELKENIVLPWTTAKTEITLLPKKEAATTNKTKTPIATPSQKSKKEQETVVVEPVVVTTTESIKKPVEKAETWKLNWNELNNETYKELEGKLIWIKDGDEVKLLNQDLLTLQTKTKTKVFSFENANQTIIEKMLAPVIIATGDMPKESVEKLINKEDTGCVSYSISDIAETLNVILKEENPDEQYINTKYFKQFCKYLLEKNYIKYDNGKYIDNTTDDKNFINVLFIEGLNFSDNSGEISVRKNWEILKKTMNANEAMHELRHAEFETLIAKDPKRLKELYDYFYNSDNLDIIKKFLNAIYSSEGFPYTWHFNNDDLIKSTKQKLAFIQNTTSEEIKSKIKSNDKYIIKRNIPLEWWSEIGTAEFNLFTEFWAYTHEQGPYKIELNHKFTWEEWDIETKVEEKTETNINRISKKLRINENQIESNNNWTFKIKNKNYNFISNDYFIIKNETDYLTIRDYYLEEKEFLQKYNFYPENMINWIEKNDSWYKIKSNWFDIWFDSKKGKPQIILWEEQYPLYITKTMSNWKKIEDQICIENTTLNNLKNISELTKELSINWKKIDWLEFDLSDEKWIIVRQKNNQNFKLSFDNELNLIYSFLKIWEDEVNVYIKDKIILEKIEDNWISFNEVNKLLKEIELLNINDNWDFICNNIEKIDDIINLYKKHLIELESEPKKSNWEKVKTQISALSNDNWIKNFLNIGTKMNKRLITYEIYNKINKNKWKITKLKTEKNENLFKIEPSLGEWKITKLSKTEKKYLGREKIIDYISINNKKEVLISSKLIELQKDKILWPILNS